MLVVSLLETESENRRWNMGANPMQAVGIVTLLLAFTVLAGAMAGGGIILAVVGVVLLGGSAAAFLKCKPQEHEE
jgi:uncharacterized membrane protein HdeD (DUF308 family)